MEFVRTDVTDDASVAALVASTVERFGDLDIVVNLATYLDAGFNTRVPTGSPPWTTHRSKLTR